MGARRHARPTRGCSGSTATRRPSTPTQQLRERERRAAARDDREYELADTGVLDEDRFFDVEIDLRQGRRRTTSASSSRPPTTARTRRRCTCCPQLWFRNTWAWGRDERTPSLRRLRPSRAGRRRRCTPSSATTASWPVRPGRGRGRTRGAGLRQRDQRRRAVRAPTNPTPFPKDGIDRRVVHGDGRAVNPAGAGTKAAFWYRFDCGRARARRSPSSCGCRPAEPRRADVRHRLRRGVAPTARAEADEFYAA